MRRQRLADLIHRSLADSFIKSVYDPRLKHVSLSAVKLSPDLRQAQIFYSISDEKASLTVQKTLENGIGYFRRLLAKSLSLKYVPKLRFVHDESIEQAHRITDLINLALDSDSIRSPALKTNDVDCE